MWARCAWSAVSTTSLCWNACEILLHLIHTVHSTSCSSAIQIYLDKYQHIWATPLNLQCFCSNEEAIQQIHVGIQTCVYKHTHVVHTDVPTHLQHSILQSHQELYIPLPHLIWPRSIIWSHHISMTAHLQVLTIVLSVKYYLKRCRNAASKFCLLLCIIHTDDISGSVPVVKETAHPTMMMWQQVGTASVQSSQILTVWYR